MAQNLLAGGTSYADQSPSDISLDIKRWCKYTIEIKQKILKLKSIANKNGYWTKKVPQDFQSLTYKSLHYLNTILEDLNIIADAIDKNHITSKEIKLLKRIGNETAGYLCDFTKAYNESHQWHEYDNPDFESINQLYNEIREYYATLIDAGNAAERLEDYMEKDNITKNTINIKGDVTGSQIQQGVNNSSQTMSVNNQYDYDGLINALIEIQEYHKDEKFQAGLGDGSEKFRNVVAESIILAQNREEPAKIKGVLRIAKELAMRVSSSVIASGIVSMISQFL